MTSPAFTVGLLVALTQSQALVLLFVVLPVVAAFPVVAFVSWRWKDRPAPIRTSTILAEGDPAEAEVLGIRQMGGPFDGRPMVRFTLRINSFAGESPFDLQVTQSMPRAVLRKIRVGETVEVRLTRDRAAGAVVWEDIDFD